MRRVPGRLPIAGGPNPLTRGDATGRVGGHAPLGAVLGVRRPTLPMASARSMARSLLARLLVAPMLLVRALPGAEETGTARVQKCIDLCVEVRLRWTYLDESRVLCVCFILFRTGA